MRRVTWRFKDLITTTWQTLDLYTYIQVYPSGVKTAPVWIKNYGNFSSLQRSPQFKLLCLYWPQMELLYPKPAYVEIDPDWLWDTIVRVVKQAIKGKHCCTKKFSVVSYKTSAFDWTESGIEPTKIEALGISTQRCSVITWNRETGKHYHKWVVRNDIPSSTKLSFNTDMRSFITWKDLRADSMVKNWNSSLTMQSLRLGSRLLYSISRSKRFQAGSVLRLMNSQVGGFLD